MRLWLSRHGEVPIREQLTTQIILGILCGELLPGQRLPSTKALARKFDLHPNTISTGYQQLEREQWLEFKRGSGVYVRGTSPQNPPSTKHTPDQLITKIVQSARESGIPLSTLRARLQQWLVSRPPEHFLVIEPDEHLRQIVIYELQQALTFPIRGCGPQDCKRPEVLHSAVPVVLPSKSEVVRKILPAEIELLTLRVRSIPASLAKYLPAPADTLLGIASRWQPFLKNTHTVLAAAGFHPDSLVVRDARQEHWQRGLAKTSAVICDSLVASQLPSKVRAICFALVSDESLSELRRYQHFIGAVDFRGL
jgi:DNA-binding transcriptional regulator YhcF (GntR family)